MIRTLLIDLDGTLIDQSRSALSQLKFMGKVLPKLRMNKGWGLAWRNLKEAAVALQKGSKDKTNFNRAVQVLSTNLKITHEEAEKLFFEALHFAFPALEEYFKPLEGAAEFIDWAKDHYPLVLATNPVWPLELVKERMKWGQINPKHFKRITTFDQMHSCKPDPDFFKEILSLENITPQECIMIGNEEKMDLPATRAGIPVFLVDQSRKRLKTLHEPTSKHPGAWKGNFSHVKKYLMDHR